VTRKRQHPDGSPPRFYVRTGKKVTSFYYKHPDGREIDLGSARTNNIDGIRNARRAAEAKYDALTGRTKIKNTTWLIDEYFIWQRALPERQRKAESTLTENEREAKNLKKFFGHMLPQEIEPQHCYAYIDERTKANNAPVKAGKEITLLSAILTYGCRIGLISANVARDIERDRGTPSTVRVEWEQVEALVEAGKAMGGAYRIMALAAQFAWLTTKRSREVRHFTRDRITTEGCLFTASKRKAGDAPRHGLTVWSPLLKATVDEAMAVKRWGDNSIPARYVFGNMAGEPYSKGGWKANWTRLHNKAAATAAEQGKPWMRFSLQDCRPGGVTEKRERGDQDAVDATLHTSSRMVDQVYDRRSVKKSKPAL
jgi:hypothetical protein